MKKRVKHNSSLCLALGAVILGCIVYFGVPYFSTISYDRALQYKNSASTTVEAVKEIFVPEPAPVAAHIKTPAQVKAVYMTSWIASAPSLRAKLVQLIDDTEINAVVIDIKDATGNISFSVRDPELLAVGASENRIRDIDEFLAELHAKGIYVIGRVAVFQDPYFVKKYPEEAVRRESDGGIWKDRKGLSFIDAGSEKGWEYVVRIGKESYSRGFDEINYDYIRFPSDGDMKDIAYTYAKGRTKPEIVKSFFMYVYENFKDTDIVTSADLFCMTTSNTDDLGIGQVLENALPYFDYVAPMVYPSHYPPTFIGYKNPAEHPYEVIKYAMDKGVARAAALAAATTTPADIRARVSPKQLRPWLQDFDLGATYTADMVRAQIKATYDSGLDSWMMWDPRNVYTAGAFLPE